MITPGNGEKFVFQAVHNYKPLITDVISENLELNLIIFNFDKQFKSPDKNSD
jgi:hypothetical protein